MSEKQSVIRTLVYPENVRQMPYMLLGDLNDSSILLREIFDNSRDELIASKNCDTIYVYTDRELYTVIDNGRGISVAASDVDPNKTQMEAALASIYSGGKYDSEEVSGGMHGIGSSAVNAVSNVFKAACIIREDSISKSTELVRSYFNEHQFTGNELLYLEFSKGIKVAEKIITYEDLSNYFGEVPVGQSTYIGFIPDETIVKSTSVLFSKTWYEYTFIVLKKFYNKDVHIFVNGTEVVNDYQPYKYEVCDEIKLEYPGKNEVLKVYLTFEFDSDLSVYDTSGSVNMISVPRGVHIELAKWMITYNLKKKFGVTHNHLTNGLKLDMILLAKKVGYNSQTKEKLTKIADFYDNDWYYLDKVLNQIYENHRDEIEQHVQRLNEYNASLQSLAARDYIKSMVNITADQGESRAKSWAPYKLKDASSSDRSKCVLYLCEGDSAGTPLIKARNPEYHAVLPLRGKSLNTVYLDLDTIFENGEIRDIISAIGLGVDQYNNTDNPRYTKIIIAADSDADGFHIAALLLGFFAAHMKFMLDNGFVYVLNSPLYKQDGKFYYADEEDKIDKSRPFERFKGLGSLRGGDIKQVLIDEDTIRLTRVTSEGIEEAIAAVGDKHTRRINMQSRNLVK